MIIHKKDAMTLAELLFVFIIIGIIATIAITTVKPWDKACKYAYSRIYHSLRLAFYNGMLMQPEFPPTSIRFCKVLADKDIGYMNTAPDGLRCSVARDLTNNPRTFPNDKVQILLSNGAKIWIGANSGKPFIHTETEKSGNVSKTKYYIVYVDINGDKGPNTAMWSEKRLSDIVAFAITDGLSVIPLGHPEVDNRYLNAHVVYPQVGEDDVDGRVSDDMTYYEARKHAWGDTVDSSDNMTLNIQNDLPNDSYFKLTVAGSALSPYYPDADSYSDFITDTINMDEGEGCSDELNCFVDVYEYH